MFAINQRGRFAYGRALAGTVSRGVAGRSAGIEFSTVAQWAEGVRPLCFPCNTFKLIESFAHNIFSQLLFG